MEKKLTFNHLAIWAAVVMYQLISMVWYGLFTEQWMALTGVTEEMAQNGDPTPFIVAIVAAAVLYYTMSFLFQKMQIESAPEGAMTAALFWLAFLFFQVMVQNMFSFREIALTFIDQGNTFLSFTLGGLLLGAWRKYRDLVPSEKSRVRQTA